MAENFGFQNPSKFLMSCDFIFLFQDSIFDVIKYLEYCDVENEEVIIEHLRLLVNLSATNIAHDEIMTGAQEFFNILSQSLSGKVQVNRTVFEG